MTSVSDDHHEHHHSTDWKHDGVRVVPGDSLDSNTPQTPGNALFWFTGASLLMHLNQV